MSKFILFFQDILETKLWIDYFLVDDGFKRVIVRYK